MATVTSVDAPTRRPMSIGPFAGLFAAAWFTLDRLVPAPPAPLPALFALVAAGTVLAVGQRLAGSSWEELLAANGLGRPELGALAVAAGVGAAVVACYLVGA